MVEEIDRLQDILSPLIRQRFNLILDIIMLSFSLIDSVQLPERKRNSVQVYCTI
jgi:hypothetical protein